MNVKSGVFLKALLAHFRPYKEKDYLCYLSPKNREEVQALSLPSNLPLNHLFAAEAWFQPIHYSWLYLALRHLPTPSQAFAMTIFEDEKRDGLAGLLKLKPSEQTASPVVKSFLFDYLKKHVFDEEIFPQFELPSSDMNALLTLNKSQLIHLINLLGIHDLGAQLRQMIDKTLLGKIYAALSKEQLQFLHYTSKQSLKWIPPKLNLQAWNGDRHALTVLLHQRGLIRLSKALAPEHKSLQWHVTRKLDTGRGKIIEKLLSLKHDTALAPYFKAQVIHLIKRYHP